ncbi:MAG: 7-carboxy-7-deazaguanine synthase QueE [Bacillaceae bacterium]|nr:7-carboxy-7-deazaguanine synthase QueE [Bacillaceae bacterium]
MKIPVLEIFGPTIQGEGAVIGKKTVFIRTAGCDYKCSWCDSAFTWDGTGKNEINLMTPTEIIEQLARIGFDNFDHVTISGGNPALLKHLDELIFEIKQRGLRVGLETQGSVWQNWMLDIDDLTISPKPPSSEINPDIPLLDSMFKKLKEVNGSVSIKVVIFDENDLNYAKQLHKRYSSIPFYLQVGNPDVKTENQEKLAISLLKKLEWLVDSVMKDPEFNKVRVLPQLHTLIWGNKKGV